MYISCCSRSKVEALYICPVVESIVSHFLTSPSREYLWKERRKSHIYYSKSGKIAGKANTSLLILRKQLDYSCTWREVSWKSPSTTANQEIQEEGRPKPLRIKSDSWTVGILPLLQPVHCNSTFLLTGKPGAFMSFWSKSVLRPNPMSLSPHHISHALVLMGAEAKGWGQREQCSQAPFLGPARGHNPEVDYSGHLLPVWSSL